jgi:REP element-mobilizing transposase RayT
MTLPRNIVPGRMLFITMRTHRRTFFFSPNDEVNQIITFLVAYASERHGVGISGMVWQSNHAHLLVNDHRGEVSAFLQTLNGALARALNALRGESGGVFERGNVHIMPVGSAQDALTALAYIGANPVAAACVEHGRQWLGVRTLVKYMGGRPRKVTRAYSGDREHPDRRIVNGPVGA